MAEAVTPFWTEDKVREIMETTMQNGKEELDADRFRPQFLYWDKGMIRAMVYPEITDETDPEHIAKVLFTLQQGIHADLLMFVHDVLGMTMSNEKYKDYEYEDFNQARQEGTMDERGIREQLMIVGCSNEGEMFQAVWPYTRAEDKTVIVDQGGPVIAFELDGEKLHGAYPYVMRFSMKPVDFMDQIVNQPDCPPGLKAMNPEQLDEAGLIGCVGAAMEFIKTQGLDGWAVAIAPRTEHEAKYLDIVLKTRGLNVDTVDMS